MNVLQNKSMEYLSIMENNIVLNEKVIGATLILTSLSGFLYMTHLLYTEYIELDVNSIWLKEIKGQIQAIKKIFETIKISVKLSEKISLCKKKRFGTSLQQIPNLFRAGFCRSIKGFVLNKSTKRLFWGRQDLIIPSI